MESVLLEDEHLKTFLKSLWIQMWLTSGKCCQKKLIMIIVQKRPRAAETAHRGRCRRRRRRCLASGWSAPQKLRCWFTTIIWKMKAYFCLEMSTIFFTAASTTSWGITKLRRELCQNALLPINKSKLSALFIIFFEGGTEHKTTRTAALFQIHTMNVY